MKQNDIFCVKCLTHERYFEGGHSWTPALCPCGEEETISWKNMSLTQRLLGQKKYNKRSEFDETS